MKSFLGNFYRHLAIFSGHTGYSDSSSNPVFEQLLFLRNVKIGQNNPVNFVVLKGTFCQSGQSIKMYVVLIFPQLAHKQTNSFYIKGILKYSQRPPVIWATFDKKFVTNFFENSPIWEHCIRHSRQKIYFVLTIQRWKVDRNFALIRGTFR